MHGRPKNSSKLVACGRMPSHVLARNSVVSVAAGGRSTHKQNKTLSRQNPSWGLEIRLGQWPKPTRLAGNKQWPHFQWPGPLKNALCNTVDRNASVTFFSLANDSCACRDAASEVTVATNVNVTWKFIMEV